MAALIVLAFFLVGSLPKNPRGAAAIPASNFSLSPEVAKAATWQGNAYGLPNYGGYDMPTSCYSYQDQSRNYANLPDCRVSSYLAEFSVHKTGVANGTTQYALANVGYYPYSYAGNGSAGSAVTVPYGTNITLEWSCQPLQTVTYSYCNTWVYGSCVDTAESSWTDYFFQSGASSNFGGSGLAGSIAVNVMANKTYTLSCSGSAGTASFSIPVTIGVSPVPTVTMPANQSMTLGKSLTLNATFAAGDVSDTLTSTAIDQPQGTHLTATTPGNKSYIFTPVITGAYTFYGVAATTQHPTLTSYGTTIVTVNPSDFCTDIPGNQASVPSGCTMPIPAPGACVVRGKAYDSGSNSCVITDYCTDIPGNQASVPSGCTMPIPAPGTCTPSGKGYDSSSNQCVVGGTIGSFTINGGSSAWVRRDTTATFGWTINNMSSCTIDSGVGSVSATDGAHTQITPTIVGATTYTLSCIDNAGAQKTSSVSAKILPEEHEI